MQEVTAIVDFFNKWDEVKTMRRKIKRTIDDSLSSVVGDIEEVNKAITERFLDLAKHRFK
jgi:hypothetical protein